MSKNVHVCDDQWHIKKSEKFTWVNNTHNTCNITQGTHPEWPFTSPSYKVPAGGTLPGETKSDLHDGTYAYEVDCCGPKTMPKNVLVP
jgi:hypothetical protein